MKFIINDILHNRSYKEDKTNNKKEQNRAFRWKMINVMQANSLKKSSMTAYFCKKY